MRPRLPTPARTRRSAMAAVAAAVLVAALAGGSAWADRGPAPAADDGRTGDRVGAAASSTPSASGSPAPTASGSPAPSASASPAPSASGSPAPTASGSPGPSGSASPAPSTSGDPSPSPSGSPNARPTPGSGETEDATLVMNRPAIAFEGVEPWQIQRPSTAAHFAIGYADAPSYLPGQTMRLAVSTDDPFYLVEVYRVGARFQLMSWSGWQPGRRQPKPVIEKSTMMVRARWAWTFSRAIPSDWPSGLYFAKLTSGGAGAQSYVPFVVRSTRASTLLFVSGALNSQAYNTWGGSSLYASRIGSPVPGARRAFAVSLDRPFARQDGMGELFSGEIPFALWLERRGYDVTYTTDYDLSIRPTAQPVPRATIFGGHDEYWGGALRDWLDLHVLTRGDMGLGVFAADTGYWKVRFRDTGTTGPRTVVLYKNATRDPTMRRLCPRGVKPPAEEFRALPCGTPGPRSKPEQALYGVQYGAIVPGYHPYALAPGVPTDLLEGTGLGPGDGLGNVAGGEVDWTFADYPKVPGLRLLAENRALRAYEGYATRAQAVIAQAPSGARTFASGTFWWTWGLEPHFAAANAVPIGFDRLTANILDWLAGSAPADGGTGTGPGGSPTPGSGPTPTPGPGPTGAPSPTPGPSPTATAAPTPTPTPSPSPTPSVLPSP